MGDEEAEEARQLREDELEVLSCCFEPDEFEADLDATPLPRYGGTRCKSNRRRCSAGPLPFRPEQEEQLPPARTHARARADARAGLPSA